jgi:tellurite resistance protein
LILKEYITSIDNTPRLREFYTNKVTEIKEELVTLNKKTKNKVTQIKINEILTVINPPAKNAKITDNDLVDLLQYYDLINELETVNGQN